MIRLTAALTTAALMLVGASQRGSDPASPDEVYLTWTAAQAETIGAATYKRGRVGGFFDGRLLKTERAYNHKLAATLFTAEAVRAAARLVQIRSRLTPDQTRALVAEAEAAGGIVVMVEIDPREGSGVIPTEWEAFLQARGDAGSAARGVNTPEMRNVKALAGVHRRNYDYDRFWMVFPGSVQSHGVSVSARSIELIVRILDKEGRAEWPGYSWSPARP